MRLINAYTREFREFVSEDDIEEYAILSHTWSTDEVTYQEWKHSSPISLRSRRGYYKIFRCCEQAIRDGYSWVWVDTCCIDKSSSAELSEAINSMFRWYQQAAVCYAYDVPDIVDDESFEAAFSCCRWLTRGWTLQELIAPKDVIFFSTNWKHLTTKKKAAKLLSSITRIDEPYLRGKPLEDASVAKKMSWAAHRKTTRKEDVAYSLLGIFDINMPLIYGEGEKAFKRLQEEILKAYPMDHTLFAWGEIVANIESIRGMGFGSQVDCIIDDSECEGSTTAPLSGLLANSPHDFKDSGGFIVCPFAEIFSAQIRGRGLSIQLPIKSILTLQKIRVAILICGYGSNFNFFPGVPIRGVGKTLGYAREKIVCLQYCDPSMLTLNTLFGWRQMLTFEPQRPLVLEAGDVVLRRNWYDWPTRYVYRWGTPGFHPYHENIVKRTGDSTRKGKQFCFWFEFITSTQGNGNQSMWNRRGEEEEEEEEEEGNLEVSLVPYGAHQDDISVRAPPEPDFGHEWVLQERQLDYWDTIPGFRHVLTMPADGSVIDVQPFPIVEVRTEKKSLGTGAQEGFIDVFDIVIRNREGPDPRIQCSKCGQLHNGHSDPRKKRSNYGRQNAVYVPT
ncbi:heterokaryon incompatibility protein-domain-containing protein [Xylariomycetidae sp. FL0641]|nr:heterokaryon incompatibility protein-domain-containing protein [Xylariomycetidae sp. FL0641]